MKKIPVVIIGAGLSGLAAAYELAKDDRFAITILEERDRIGGRTHAVTVNSTAIDVGGFIIYPWYKTFRRIAAELDIHTKLSPLPHLDIFYDLEGKGEFSVEKDVPISLTTKGRLAAKLLPAFLKNLDIAHPNIARFQEMTVKEFFTEKPPAVTDDIFTTYIDIVCQGYCYPPIDIYKTAFMLPMMANNLFFGDIKTADYFKLGMKEILNALEENLLKKGVLIKKNTSVTHIKPHEVHTANETYTADAIVMSHPVGIDIPFTRFATVTVTCNNAPEIRNGASWGALFLHPTTCTTVGILSIINTAQLYGKNIEHTLTLNIKLSPNDPEPTSSPLFAQHLAQELQNIFPQVTEVDITSCTLWNHTMPISDAKTIEHLHEIQGKDGIFYAGDYLGCPSMETALTTGVDAAELIKKTC